LTQHNIGQFRDDLCKTKPLWLILTKQHAATTKNNNDYCNSVLACWCVCLTATLSTVGPQCGRSPSVVGEQE